MQIERFVRVSAHSAHCATLSLISIMIFRMELLKYASKLTEGHGKIKHTGMLFQILYQIFEVTPSWKVEKVLIVDNSIP